MRPILKSGLCLLTLAATISACVSEDIVKSDVNDGNSLQLSYSVEGSTIQTLDTRGDGVPGTLAENAVDNVMVLFFASTTDGSGLFTGYSASVTSDNPSTASGTSRVGMPTGVDLEDACSLIILGNYTKYLRKGDSPDLEDFITKALTGKTQAQARTIVKGYADAITGIKAKDGLPMSCEYNKAQGTNLININFKRAVARVDLINSAPSSNFVLHSAQIWNVRKTAVAIGSNSYGTESDYTHYSGREVTTDNGHIEGNLYAFENNTLTSGIGDAVTTCLIVSGYYNNDNTKLSYYRINVVSPGLNQTMGRNRLFTINIKSVAGEGKDNPDDAYSYNKSIIKYEINEWDDSFNGMYAFDEDGNGLAVSIRNVTFANTGGQIDIDVYRINSSDPSKVIADDWTVAMSSQLEGSNFIVSKIENQSRFNLRAPSENVSEIDRLGVAEIKWGRIMVPVNVTQLNYQSQVHGLKIVPTYLRFPAAGGSKKMTISLEGNFSNVTEEDVRPTIIYGTAGESWLTATYNSGESNTTKGVFVYDVACAEMATGNEYRTADLKVTFVQNNKTVIGAVNATQARSYNEGDEGYIRQIDVIMQEYISVGKYQDVGSTTDRYKKFEGLPESMKEENDMHFNIVAHEMRRYKINLSSSMDWRLVTPAMSGNLHYKVTEKNLTDNTSTVWSDNVGSTAVFYKGASNSIFMIEIHTMADVASGWSDSFYIEFENGDTKVFRVFQRGIVAAIGENTAYTGETVIDPATLFYYETMTINGAIWLDRNIGATTNGYYSVGTTNYPKNDIKARGGYFVMSQANNSCPKGFRIPRAPWNTTVFNEWDYIAGLVSNDPNKAIQYTGSSPSESSSMPYTNVFYLTSQTNPEKQFFLPICGYVKGSVVPKNTTAVYFTQLGFVSFNVINGNINYINSQYSDVISSLRCVRDVSL